ncbi:MAG: SRPBCC domain-containing protein [Desulfobacterales bacterium]|nr:SRPBCC domain-containing protein [Desulfobacterales bacterium]
MEMEVDGEGAITASPEEIWKVIFDPAFMSQVIPGCKDIAQPTEDEYQVKMVLGIPALQGRYSGALRILEKNPFETIKGSIEGQGGLGKIDGAWEMQFEKSDDQQSRVLYAINVDISGPMASMVGGFMEQVADSLVKQGLDSFNQAIKATQENAAPGKPLISDAPPQPNFIKMLFNSVWDVMSSKLRSLFKPKSAR